MWYVTGTGRQEGHLTSVQQKHSDCGEGEEVRRARRGQIIFFTLKEMERCK